MPKQKIKIIGIEDLGWNNGELNYPSGICLNKISNQIVVCDMHNHRVVWMDMMTREKGIFSAETSDGKILDKPLAICCSKSGSIYMADAGHNCIYLYRNTCWDPIKGGFQLPGAIAVDTEENLYVSNFLDNTIICLKEDRKWEYLDVEVDKPYGLYCDGHRLYITNTGENQIIEYEINSHKKIFISEDRSMNSSIVPIAVTADEAGDLYISEQRKLLFYDKKEHELTVLLDRAIWKNEMERFHLKCKLAHIGSVAVANEGCFFFGDTIKNSVYKVEYEKNDVGY